MPARYDLSWDGTNKRWRVQHGKQRFVVSCRQLVKLGYLAPDSPHTKEASYQAANLWWAARLKEQGIISWTDTTAHIRDRLIQRQQWAADMIQTPPKNGRFALDD